jgi:hypothetical protein
MDWQSRVVRGFVAALALTLCASRLRAAPIPLPVVDIEVDEYGNGTVTPESTGIPFPTLGSLQADPGPGGLSSTLTYSLLAPPDLVAGDIFLTEGVGGAINDVIRFNPAGTGSVSYPASLVFYSDNTDGFDALADTASPPTAFYTNTVTIAETGTETNNGAFYTPTVGQPGAVTGFTVNYHFISDLPEPTTAALMGVCVALGLLSRRRKPIGETSHS